MAVCAEFLILSSLRITSTHTCIQIHTRSNLGLVQRNEYMWHFDCPKESDEVLFFLINTPNPSCCLENASQCIELESTGHSNNYYKNWTKGGKVICKSQIVIIVIWKRLEQWFVNKSNFWFWRISDCKLDLVSNSNLSMISNVIWSQQKIFLKWIKQWHFIIDHHKVFI